MAKKQPEEEPKDSNNDFWKQFINGLDVLDQLPTLEQNNAQISPEIETLDNGRYTKLVFEVNLFTAEGNDRCIMIHSVQRMFDFGRMDLSEAILKAKGKKR